MVLVAEAEVPVAAEVRKAGDGSVAATATGEFTPSPVSPAQITAKVAGDDGARRLT